MIFIDRSIPKSVAAALKQVRDDVVWLEDAFPHRTTETEWLPEVGRREWLVISRDKKIRTRPGERRMLQEGKVGCFIIGQKKNPTRWEYLKLLAVTLDEMEEIFSSTQRPFIYVIHKDGRLSRVA